MKEEWKYILNSKDYMISTHGRVKSFVRNKANGEILKLQSNDKGYQRIMLRVPVARTRHLVHRLVAQHFIENETNKCCVNHIDNDPSNNNVENLEWCTYSENLIHAEKQGRLSKVHAKAGRATGLIKMEEKEKLIEDMIGKTYGKLYIVSISEKKYNSRHKIVQYSLNTVCGCGKSFTTDSTGIRIGNTVECRECFNISKIKKNYDNLVDEILGATIRGYEILNLSEFNPGTKKGNISLTGKCTTCGSVREIKHNKLILKSRQLNCKNCKTKT